jgi:hypothetical protein
LETCCGYEYDQMQKLFDSLGFSRVVEDAPDSTELSSSTSHKTLALDKLISGCEAVKEKRQLFPGPSPTSPSSFTLPFKFYILVPES